MSRASIESAPSTSAASSSDGEAAPVVIGVVAWVALVVVAWWRGRTSAVAWKVRAVPIMGTRDLHLVPATVLVVVVGLALVAWLPAWCRRVSWRRMLVGVALVAMGWGLALALVRGPSSLDRAMANQNEYPAVVHRFDAIGASRFAATFTDPAVLARYPIHVEGHPLGATLVFVGLDRVGLGGARGAVVFLLAASAVTAPAVLVATRAVAGDQLARRAAPFLVVGPAAIWTVTSADALFAAVGALAVAVLVVATGPSPSREDDPAAPGRSLPSEAALGLAGGALFGIGVELTYGLAPLVLIPVVVAVWRRRWTVLGCAALGGALVVGGAGLAGFWWPDGLAATKVRYVAGIATVRPRGYWTLFGNPAAFALCLGPAAVVGLIRLRDRRLAVLVLSALAAVAAADLSGLSKAEVERIWLLFAPWVLLATASIALAWRGPPDPTPQSADGQGLPRRGASVLWASPASLLLAVQVLVAVAIESTVRTPW